MKLWVAIGVLLALALMAVVFGVGMLGFSQKSTTTTVTVPQAAATAPADEKPDAAEPESKPEAAPAKEETAPKPEPEKPAVKPAEPDKQPAKKPDTKPVPAAKPAKSKGLPKLVDIGGENCIPCKMMLPVLDGLKTDYKGKLEVVVISKDKDPGALKRYRTSTIPTQVLYDADGKEIARHFGFWAKDEILAAFEKHGIDL